VKELEIALVCAEGGITVMCERVTGQAYDIAVLRGTVKAGMTTLLVIVPVVTVLALAVFRFYVP